ncbi:MAG: TetR family transcriptional regulator [Sciscionella sp.]
MAGELTAAKRRGRRPSGEDTRAALLTAAREVFTEQGYERATVRAIAGRAGVDAAMVNHWFGGKDELFLQAIVRLPFHPSELVERLLQGDNATLAWRMIRTFLEVWDSNGGGALTALVRSISAHEAAAAALRGLFVRQVFRPVIAAVAPDESAQRSELRAALCASQLIGLGMARYVLKFEPLASADAATVVDAIAPTVQRYLAGDFT